MSRKDYVAIAAAIASVDADYKGLYSTVISEVAEEIANVLQADNPRFDPARFLAAARYEEEPQGLTHEDRDKLITKALGIEPGETLKIDLDS